MAAIQALSHLKWSYSPEQIATEQASIVSKATQVLDEVGACTGPQCTFATVVDPLMRLDADIEAATSSVTFVKDVSTDAAVRDAAAAAQSALSAFEVKVRPPSSCTNCRPFPCLWPLLQVSHTSSSCRLVCDLMCSQP